MTVVPRFRRPSSEMLISLSLFAALIIVILALGGNREPDRPYDLNSAAPRGLLALRWWLQEMGYRVEAIGADHFTLPQDADLFFVYPNARPYTAAEATGLSAWVKAGGTLVLIGPDSDDHDLIDAFGVRNRFAPNPNRSESLEQQQPLLPESPSSPNLGSPNFAPSLDLEDAPQAVAVIGTGDNVMVAVQPLGNGTVWHLSLANTLTNAELQGSDQGALIPAFLRTVPSSGYVVFDTYHLYQPETAPGEGRIHNMRDWVWGTPGGWALLFSALTVCIYLVLQGRRLGPPLPAIAGTRRREAAEYVEAVAALLRRGRKRQSVASHHRRRLKIGLGRPLHISPDLDDAQFLQRLAEAGHLAPDRLNSIRDLLAGLSQPADEGQLVRLVAQVDEVLRD